MTPLGMTEAAVLAALQQRLFPEAPWSESDCAALLGSPGCFGWLSLDEDESPNGFLLARQAATEIEILTLGVLPKARQRGIGRAFLQALMKVCSKRCADRIFLEVAESNEAALGLYISSGFRVAGRRNGYYKNGSENEDALLLRCDIEEDAQGNYILKSIT